MLVQGRVEGDGEVLFVGIQAAGQPVEAEEHHHVWLVQVIPKVEVALLAWRVSIAGKDVPIA